MRIAGMETLSRILKHWLDRRRHERAMTRMERRQWARYASQLATNWQPAFAEDEPLRSAKIRDVSQGGIGLLVDEQPNSGDLLHVELPPPVGTVSSPMLTCVVHTEPNEDGDGWALGCSFIRELTNEEMQTFF